MNRVEFRNILLAAYCRAQAEGFEHTTQSLVSILRSEHEAESLPQVDQIETMVAAVGEDELFAL